ncbi:terpene synthase family protein [Acrocarpospora sp. B8E8]|uniref:terpene synthase family protein n=1 Tax=Acrocarpospora sp. B8E8 TaxID=3153572 RepID=UPI00325ED0DD
MDLLASAAEQGRICALAATGQRYLMECAATQPDLFPPKPFAPGLFSSLALANSFSSPDATAEDLRVLLRTALWVFAADWQMDYVASTPGQVDELVRTCVRVAEGGDPATPLTTFLQGIRDDLAERPAYEELQRRWRDVLRRFVAAMAREWHWRAAGDKPALGEYLANAASAASSFVNLTHWIALGDPATLRHLDQLMDIGDEVQRVLRLLNDLAGYERDQEWGDLNALLLGATRAEVTDLIMNSVDVCRKRLDPLRGRCPGAVAYLERQIGFSTGFYGHGDYWGEL